MMKINGVDVFGLLLDEVVWRWIYMYIIEYIWVVLSEVI